MLCMPGCDPRQKSPGVANSEWLKRCRAPSNRVVRNFAKAVVKSAITRHYSDIGGLSSQGIALKVALGCRLGMLLRVSLWLLRWVVRLRGWRSAAGIARPHQSSYYSPRRHLRVVPYDDVHSPTRADFPLNTVGPTIA
jgi:hypothetical protein